MKRIVALTIACLTLITIELYAQDSLNLTLQEALSSAVRANQDIVLAMLNHQAVLAQSNESNAVFLPQVNFSYTVMRTSNPLSAFGFKLQQQSVLPTDFDPQLLNHPSATQNYNAKIEISQPILNLDLIHQRKAAQHQVKVYENQTARIKEFTVFETTQTYTQLQLAHQAVRVLNEALVTAKTILKTTNLYFDKGYVQKSDVLMVHVQVAMLENKLAEAKSNVRNISDYLNLLMGSKTGPLITTDSLKKVNDEVNDPQIPVNRSDFNALMFALKAQESLIQTQQFSILPRLNAFANYQFNDKKVLGFGSGSYLMGAQLSWTIFNGLSSYYKTSAQKINYSKLQQQLNQQKDKSQVELNKAMRKLEDCEFSLRSHSLSVDQAVEAFRILQNRFEQGLAPVNDLLKAQSVVSEQKLFLSETVAAYNITHAYLIFLTTTSEK